LSKQFQSFGKTSKNKCKNEAYWLIKTRVFWNVKDKKWSNGWNGKYLVEGVKYMRLWKSWKETTFSKSNMCRGCQMINANPTKITNFTSDCQSNLIVIWKNQLRQQCKNETYWLIKTRVFWNVKDEKWSNVMDGKQVTWNGSLFQWMITYKNSNTEESTKWRLYNTQY
jgi:hypothetical protein